MDAVPVDELVALLQSAFAPDALGRDARGGAIVVDLGEDSHLDAGGAIEHAGVLPYVLVGIGPESAPRANVCDVVVEHARAAEPVLAAVDAHPVAATALALLLRGAARRTVVDGLIAESSTYSTLQAGPEFAAWLATRPRPRPHDEPETPLRVDRANGTLRITLARPQVRNAFNAAMRDALIDACAIAASDPAIDEVIIAGDGPAFCSGGDLAEFGSFDDPARAHLVRLSCSAPQALAAIADRMRAHVHGACIGAGIELAAFARHVRAAPDATFALPEIGMGLVPGAGGSVSITRRIGRQRTAWMAITGSPVDAPTALAWGLIDEIAPLPLA